MASDESRPGSSASNSTSSSEQFENGSQSQSSSRRSRSNSANSNSSSSRDNSPETQNVDLKGPRSPAPGQIVGQENNDSQSRSISRASNQSDASNNSSDNDENGSLQSGQNSNLSGKAERSRSQSASPTRQSHSRNSSVSSVPDAINSSAEQSRHDAINMSHEDLSDVSDLESATASPADNDDKEDDDEEEEEEEKIEESVTDGKAEPIIDLRQKINERKQESKQIKDGDKNSPSIVDELNDIMDKKHDEDALDFEAEDGECEEKEPQAPPKGVKEAIEAPKKPDSDGEINENDELEEGEVSDEDEKRPEETEPKPVCRFYTRGQCTWGMSCRFLHPGVTDKGNYTMFDMIRPVPVNAHAPPYGPGGVVPAYHDFRSERLPMHHPMHGFGNGGPPQARPPIAEPVVESAWERGLRTAKEMMRKANKRKEQDMDFEDKKMNLSASQDEIEKDNYYIRERSPEIAAPPFGVRPGMHHPAMGGYSPPPRIGMPPRGAPMPFEHEDPYNRSLRYRELPPHRMPQYEDDINRQKIRPAREVIVQRAEPVGRPDEWNDPWMRSKSPVREKRTKRRSYSSNSSYSSSSDSSSKSGSSSNSSRSPTPGTRRRRYSSTRASSHKSPVRGRHLKRSPTPELHKRRGVHSPVQMHPMNKEAHFEVKKDLRNHPTLSKRANPNIVGRRSSPPPPPKKSQPTPPNVEKRVTRSPIPKRKRASPPVPPPRKPISFSLPKSNNLQKRKRSSSSGSGSSGSSGSESDSSDSSSSSGSSNDGHKSRTRDKVVSERKMANKKVEASRKRSPTTAQNKALADGIINSSSKSSSSASAANSKKSTRREELLKQLRAVEDAIARKRSKLN